MKGQDPEWLEKLRKIHPFKLFMWIAIFSIGIMFLFLIVGFVLTNKIEKFYLPRYFTLSTLLLAASSFAMSRTLGAYKNDQIKVLHTGLVAAFLIAQVSNNNNRPLYGVDIMGANWRFVTMEGKDYCISKAFDSVDKEDLLTIIAVLRKFKHILETRLMID